MRVCIHRGSKEIGGSCVEIENGGQRLIIDLGLPLDAEDDHERYLPHIDGLDGSDPGLLGILISHPHLDHYGLLPHISSIIPVGMGADAWQILNAAHPFSPGKWTIPAIKWNYQNGQSFDIGPFKVTPFLVDHSAFDAYSLLIESDGKKIFYSGDIRFHGRKSLLMDNLIKKTPDDVDVLLLEGSSIGRLDASQQFPTEKAVEDRFLEVFKAAKGLALVHTSGQNIDRIVSIFRASKRANRRLIIDLYVAVILEATGRESIPQSNWPEVVLYVPQSQRVMIKNNKLFDLLERHSKNRLFIEHIQEAPERFTLLFRPLHISDLDKSRCLVRASYIYSQWEGYWEQGKLDGVSQWLGRNAINNTSIHTSGHASIVDLQRFAEAVSARKVVPIHSFMPEKYSRLFKNVKTYNDGQWWEI